MTTNPEGIGNKALGLCLCAELGIPVPPWFAIPAETIELRPWRQDPHVEEALLGRANSLQGDGDYGWIVRSSTTLEDSSLSSHAGEFRAERIDSLTDLIPAVEAVSDTRSRDRRENVPAGVIIQRYIAGTLSGVAFSCRPSGGTLENCYCEWVEGGCEQLVQGTVSPRSTSIDIRRGKTSCIEWNGEPGLTNELARMLLDWLLKLEGATDKPYDIEWVYDRTTLWCVQARPVTRINLDPGYLPGFCATSWFFDERIRVPLTPMTRSTLMRLVFKAALQDPVNMAGGSASPEDVFYYSGRPYVPHRFYRQMFAGVPRLLLTSYLHQLFPERCWCANRTAPTRGAWHSLIRKAFKIVAAMPSCLLNRRVWRRFESELHRELPSLKRLPSPASQDWFEHWKLIDGWTERFLEIHRWSILIADYSSAAFDLCLRLLPRRWAASLRKQFTNGLRLPTADANRGLLAYVQQGEMGREEFVEKFGHRSESLDYSQRRWAERFSSPHPAAKFPLLREIEAGAFDANRGRLRLPGLSELVEMREQQRFEWERILSLQRSMLTEMGARLSSERGLQSPDDIWFLHWDELYALTAGKIELDEQEIEYRKHVNRIEARVRTPQFIPGLQEEEAASSRAVFTGLGASAGRARGPVIVIRDICDLYERKRKDSIVVMSNMSPADTPVMLGISGVVLERGGLLSHAAIMAREYGVPMVTGVDNATEILRTGMIAVVDGDSGAVEVA